MSLDETIHVELNLPQMETVVLVIFIFYMVTEYGSKVI